MIFIVISLVIFLLSTILHVWLHRWLKKNNITSFKTSLIFFLGWLINLIIVYILTVNQNKLNVQVLNWWALPLPYTSVLIFILLSLAYFFIFIGPFLKDLSPTYKILLILHKKKALSKEAILEYFSDNELIFNRLKYLVNQGYIRSARSKYFILPKGKIINHLIITYRGYFNWKEGG